MKEVPASSKAGDIATAPAVIIDSDIAVISKPAPVMADKDMIAINNAGSIRTDIITSLLLPIPPNTEPPSNPPRTIANLNIVNM